MVVAADDGVMPQTREHAAVLAALGVERRRGRDHEGRPRRPGAARRARRPRCCRAPRSCPVAAPRGEGLDELRAALDRVAARAAGRAGGGGALRLHVDRSFTIRGAGTVVTGTLWSGSARRAATRCRILPVRAAARGSAACRSTTSRVERAEAGQRVALNLAGVGRDEVARGDVVVARRARRPGRAELSASTSALAWVTPDARPDGGARVAVHHGTRETPAAARRARRPLLPAPARAAARAARAATGW